jgi:acyl transferase domain-containing protein
MQAACSKRPVSADALEDAGISMARVAGTETGVFVGISSYDYAVIQQGQSDRMLIDAHSNTGGALSIAANRISYFFNLRGMSVALDTACSCPGGRSSGLRGSGGVR